VTTIGTARVSFPFVHGVDALVPFTKDQLVSFKARYAIRVVGAYVETLAAQPAYRDLIFSLDLAILLYSEASIGNVDGTVGEQRGTAAAKSAQAIGAPAGIDFLIDMEDVSGPGIVDYVNARATAYEQVGGYGSLLYVGEPLPAGITPQVLQAMRPHRYMRSCSKGVPEPIARKWCVLQHSPGDYLDPILNIHVDHFTIEQDALGNYPTLWSPT
jgi:hypothetical protein